jgi:hypothetical protein
LGDTGIVTLDYIMTSRSTDELLRLYELATHTEREQFGRYQSIVAFYTGIITAVIGATLAGTFSASQSHHFLLLLAGPLLTASVCEIAISATTRSYQVWLEDVTVRAKLEYDLELTKPREKEGKWWATEPIVPTRYVGDRTNADSSEDFVRARLKQGYHRRVVILFRVLIALAAVLLSLLLYLAIYPAGRSGTSGGSKAALRSTVPSPDLTNSAPNQGHAGDGYRRP